MTQEDRVIAALRKIGGEGTLIEIFNATNTKGWTAKDPKASIASLLSRGSKKGVFKQTGKIWAYIKKNKSSQKPIRKKSAGSGPDRGLYLIAFTPYVKPTVAGFLFKIGKSDDVLTRFKAYNACLPFPIIRQLDFYPIPDKKIDLVTVEKQVRNQLVKNGSPGLNLKRYTSGGQTEWLQVSNLPLETPTINKLARAFTKIVKGILSGL
jgi:hypothetical protein